MASLPFVNVEREGVARYGPGEAPASWRSGDFILTHGDAWTSRMIRFGESLRIHGDDRKYTFWNHAALVVSDDGDLVEALGRGVCRTNASHYQPREYHLVCVKASDEDRKEVVRFGETMADRHERYGFLTIASIAYTLLTGGKFTFAIDGQEICSGLVARAMERTDAIFSRTPSHIMPADLAKYYDVEPAPGGPQ